MRKLNNKSFLMVLLLLSLVAGLIGSTGFPGYIKGVFVIPVVMTHSLVYYLLYTRSIKEILFKNKVQKGKSKKVKKVEEDLDPIPEIEDMNNRDLLQRERELFKIAVNEVPVPRTITQQLKDVRQELKSRGITL